MLGVAAHILHHRFDGDFGAADAAVAEARFVGDINVIHGDRDADGERGSSTLVCVGNLGCPIRGRLRVGVRLRAHLHRARGSDERHAVADRGARFRRCRIDGYRRRDADLDCVAVAVLRRSVGGRLGGGLSAVGRRGVVARILLSLRLGIDLLVVVGGLVVLGALRAGLRLGQGLRAPKYRNRGVASARNRAGERRRS